MDAEHIPFAGVVARKDGKFLFVQEGYREARGLWSIPVGRVEAGESARAAAVRETREETGYIIRLSGRKSVMRLRGMEMKSVRELNPSTISLTVFEATVIGGEMNRGADMMDAKWLSMREIETLPLRGEWVINAVRNT